MTTADDGVIQCSLDKLRVGADPQVEGAQVRYIGSKSSTLEALSSHVLDHIGSGTFCDPFGGVGCVGSHFKRQGFVVHAGDILKAAHAFQTAKIVLDETPTFRGLREVGIQSADEAFSFLNRSPRVTGWLTREFAVKRQFFTVANARRADAVRRLIAAWNRKGLLQPGEHSFLLACLIESVDKVANTAGTYYAYLKSFDRHAELPFEIRPLSPTVGATGCTATLADAQLLVSTGHFNVLYLDPPYNPRDYAGYYHLPETLAAERRPRPVGFSGVSQAPRPKSAFYRPSMATGALTDLLNSASFDLLLVQYVDTGVIDPDAMLRVLKQHGTVKKFDLNATGYTTKSSSRASSHALYVVRP